MQREARQRLSIPDAHRALEMALERLSEQQGACEKWLRLLASQADPCRLRDAAAHRERQPKD